MLAQVEHLPNEDQVMLIYDEFVSIRLARNCYRHPVGTPYRHRRNTHLGWLREWLEQRSRDFILTLEIPDLTLH